MQNNNQMRPKRQMTSLGILLALIVVSFYIIFKNFSDIDPRVMMRVFRHIDMRYVLAAIACLLLYILSEGCNMAVIAYPLGHPYGPLKTLVYSAVDLYFSAITPSATGGQPAVMYYMAQDGIPITKSTTILLFNLTQYTASLLVMAAAVLVIKPGMIFAGGPWITVLFLLGIAIHIGLMILFVLCMFRQKLIRSVGLWIVRLLCRLHLMKHQEERVAAFECQLTEYRDCMIFVRKRPALLVGVFLGNVLQRMAMFSIAYFIYRGFGLSLHGYWEIIGIQVVIAMAVNSLPLPGAVGVAEAAFLMLYGTIYSAKLLMPAMLFTRGVSYYLCFILCGVITIVNHVIAMRVKRKGQQPC